MNNNSKILELVNNKGFIDQLVAKETPEDVQALFAENGVDVSLDEVDELGKAIATAIEGSDSENLSEDELENVSGGVISWIVVGKLVVAGGGAALSLYKWYKSR